MKPIQLILDTNILVEAVRASQVWDRIKTRFDPMMAELRPVYCSVTEGELRSLSAVNSWNNRKNSQVEFLLGYFQIVPIEGLRLMTAYANIDSAMRKLGHKMGKNDLWIAAAASVNNLTLLTTDRDFDPLSPSFIRREWIDPNTANPTP